MHSIINCFALSHIFPLLAQRGIGSLMQRQEAGGGGLFRVCIQFITDTKLNLRCQQMCSKLYLLLPSREQLFLFSG